MPRLCPRCKNPLGDQPKCTNCGYRAPRRGRERGERQAASWQQTPWGKTIIGLVVAQGLWYTLLLLARTVVSATGNDVQEWMKSFPGLVLMQGMSLVSLLIGGMLAGAGKKRGAFNGTIVGVYNAVFFLLIFIVILKNELPAAAIFVLLVLQITFGMIGGFLGTLVWKPIQAVTPLPDPAADPRLGAEKLLATKEPRVSVFAGPIAWFRDTIGTAVIVTGTLLAPKLFTIIREMGGEPETAAQVKFLTWEIAALAMFIGGAVGGSNSSNGIKQGTICGVAASFVLMVIYMIQGDTTAADTASWLFQWFGFEQSALLQKLIFTTISVMLLSVVGGWFGSQLLPPLVIPPRQKRMLPTMS